MPHELTKEIIVRSMAAIAAALFSGIPAAVLVWWTWQRDRERVIVQKLAWPEVGKVLCPNPIRVAIVGSCFTE